MQIIGICYASFVARNRQVIVYFPGVEIAYGGLRSSPSQASPSQLNWRLSMSSPDRQYSYDLKGCS
jgi:hypothetical protein